MFSCIYEAGDLLRHSRCTVSKRTQNKRKIVPMHCFPPQVPLNTIFSLLIIIRYNLYFL